LDAEQKLDLKGEDEPFLYLLETEQDLPLHPTLSSSLNHPSSSVA
jgi:hypothetical protein